MRELERTFALDSRIHKKIKKKKSREAMKSSPSSSLYCQEMYEQGLTAVGMEVDDTAPLDFLGELERPPLDADFLNSFEDDFDDADIN